MEQKRPKSVAIWLFLCSTMIILMVGIGGFTRLSNAGLSITEWDPITGALPPLNKQNWLQEKSKYEATPEYKAFNYGMSMEEFRTLYLIEYIHRLAARLTGLIFILPFIYFTLKKRISKKIVTRLSIALLFGVLQAFAGWYMVKSGLVAKPHVSHYMLALHLLLALVIFALLLYQFFDYQIRLKQTKLKISGNTIPYTGIILIMIVVQMIFGAFVAGLNAGLIYNTFPLMDGHIIPKDLFFLRPIWLNIFENRGTVQFIHRALALLILAMITILTIKNTSVKPVYAMLLSVIIQIILGVVTLLLHIPITTAIAHQMSSFILFGSGLYFLCYLRKQS
ncbi:heme A synthase [Wolbachia endosymbiont of Litomosoides brasiliensis]|uniref:COX15/CtaA family protein n=1 Tax=Wolbachia endosymbiont of Litomosoides brasiliensis TaxID=1812117 RepID=UPI00158B0876|nr:COX15/CtaA family protein [Wolbachia endosymbiont of Litomosoides brasiliensis]NUY39183.1 heme A synthase [Wolbachia endosymbiont of Litomosoides brasiliensis]